jgi:hypothetical protein
MSNRYGQNKKVTLLNATIATDATTSAIVDRLGFDYVNIDVTMRPATATNSSAKWTVLKVGHADTTNVSDAVNISGLIGTTNSTAATTVSAAEFVIPANNSTTVGGTTAQNGGGQLVSLSADLRGKGRYLFLTIQANASHQTAHAVATLFKGEKMPRTATERNVGVAVNV